MVRLSYGGGSATVNKFGQGTGNVCPMAYEPLVPDLEGYIGDVVIRKYPFNPNEPFYETDSIS
jgi:primary-amine oxidase